MPENQPQPQPGPAPVHPENPDAGFVVETLDENGQLTETAMTAEAEDAEAADTPSTPDGPSRNADGTFAKKAGAEEPAPAEAGDADAEDKSWEPGDIPEGVAKQLHRTRRQRNDAEEKAAAAEAERDRLKAENDALKAAEALDPNDFDTYEEFQEAKAKVAKPPAPAKAAAPEEIDGIPQADFQTAFANVQREVEDADPDLWAKATDEDSGLKVSAPMVVALADEPDPAVVLRHLVENPAEAEKIAGMRPRQAERAIVRLGLRLDQAPAKPPAKEPAPRKASQAPEPANPVSGRTPTETTSRNAQNFKDYEAARDAEEKSRDRFWL